MSTRIHVIAYSLLGLAVVALSYSLWSERHGAPLTAQQAVAHAATVSGEQEAARIDTVFGKAKVVMVAARVDYAPIRDSLRRLLADSLTANQPVPAPIVRAALAKVDTVLRSDSLALFAAEKLVAAKDTVISRKDAELKLAQDRLIPPRLSGAASALYDPLSAAPAASVQGGFRVIGNVSLIARGDQRFAPGEKPRGYVGVALAF